LVPPHILRALAAKAAALAGTRSESNPDSLRD